MATQPFRAILVLVVAYQLQRQATTTTTTGVLGADLPGVWPQFRHGFDSDGLSDLVGPSGLGLASPVVKNYSLSIEGTVLSSPVLDDKDNVYVTTTSGRLVGFATDQTLVLNVSLNVSLPKANCQLNGIPSGAEHYGIPLTATPIVVGSGILAGSVQGEFASYNTNGGLRWSYTNTTGACYSAALSGRGEVVFTSQGLRIFAVDLTVNPPQERWSVDLRGQEQVSSIQAGPSVASDDATVYVASIGNPDIMNAITPEGNMAPYSWRLSAAPLTTAAVWVCNNSCVFF